MKKTIRKAIAKRPAREPQPVAPQPEMNVSLSIDERDAIDRAKGRIRRFSALITSYSYVCKDGLSTDDDAEDAIGELTELMYEAALEIDEAFTSADFRAQGLPYRREDR